MLDFNKQLLWQFVQRSNLPMAARVHSYSDEAIISLLLAQRVEHYEIAGYGTAAALVEKLGFERRRKSSGRDAGGGEAD